MSLRETLERIRTNPTPGNEETAKCQTLAPISADLSWDRCARSIRERATRLLEALGHRESDLEYVYE